MIVAVMRPASIDSALSQPPSVACRPNSPKVTVLPRVALPRIAALALAILHSFGINGMTHPAFSLWDGPGSPMPHIPLATFYLYPAGVAPSSPGN